MKAALIVGTLLLVAGVVFGCARDDGMGQTWKGVRCVETGRC